MSVTPSNAAAPPPTRRMKRNTLLLSFCEFVSIYFFFLHLKTWWIASAALGVLTAAMAVLIKWNSWIKEWFAPAARWFLDWQATAPILAVIAVVMTALLLTTVSVNVRLTDGTSAKVVVSSPQLR